MFRRVPPASQRQGGGETGSGNAEQQSQREEFSVGIGELPAECQRNEAHAQADKSGAPAAVAFGHPAKNGTEERPAQ